MQDLTATAYVSSASRAFLEEDLERLLVSARQFNLQNQVTGVLLYDEGNFFQYVEGPSDGIERVYQKIEASTSHSGIIRLFKRQVLARSFQDWNMGFTKAPKSLLLNLSQASWAEILSSQKGKPNIGMGVGLLIDFWSQAKTR